MMAVVSALQKAIRRGDGRLAGYWAIEMWESGLGEYCWRRLLIISAEDCWGLITTEIEALYRAYQIARKPQSQKAQGGRIFVAKAALLLASVAKCRDADHLSILVYDKKQGVSDEELERDLDEARRDLEPIPDYAYDCHTAQGRRAGKTKADFVRDEFEALRPRQAGLFDNLVV